LYSLTKLYKCDINVISSSNPGVEAGIQEGQVLHIPVASCAVKGQSLQEENGKSYLMHEVQKKETMFSIAKSYAVDVNELITLNPGTDAGIKKGQVIKIPVKGSKTVAPPQPAMTKHLVEPGETLYSISKKYNVTVADIQNANGGLKDGLKAGTELLIPVNIGSLLPSGEPMGTLPDKRFGKEVFVEGPIFKEKYHIALLLPFYTNYKDSMDTRDKKLRDAAVSLYRGAMLAADSLMKMGLDAEIHVYDVVDDKKAILALLEKPELKEMD
jgi:LysM repeat protein